MSFNAGAVTAKMEMDTTSFKSGMSSVTKGIGTAAAAIGVTFVAAMTVATKKANTWQKSLSNVNTLIDTSVVDTQKMAKGLIGMDASLGSTIELTDALYQSFSSGADNLSEAMAITEDSAKFARAGLMDTAVAVDVLTTAQNAYGKEAMSTAEASDIFFTTIKQGKITGDELASSIGASIPLFASMNIPLEELSAGMAAMTKQGVNAASSTTQLNALVTGFLKPSEEMSAALAAQGYASGSALLETEGLAGALEFLEETTGGSKEELSKILPNTRAVRGALALTGQGAVEFASILDEMGNSAGATDEAFAKQELTFDTLSNQMEKIELLAGNVGKHFVDKIAVGAITAGNSIVGFINSSAGMEIISQIAGTAAGVFEVLRSTGMLLVEKMLPPFKSLISTVAENMARFGEESISGAGAAKILGGTVQLLSAGFSIVMSVVNMVIDTIVDLVFVITKSAQSIGSFFDMLTGKAKFKDVKQNFKDVGEAFKTLGGGIVANYVGIIDTAVNEFTKFGTGADEATVTISTKVKQTSDAAKNYTLSNWDEMLTGQTLFVGKSTELEDERETAVEETAVTIEETELGLIDTLKKAWAGYFADAVFSWKGLYENVTETIAFGLDGASSISDLYYDNEQDKIDIAHQEELDALALKLENELITQAEYDAAVEEIDAAALVKSNALAKKQFESEKALNIAQTWMDAGASIAGWWSAAPSLGPFAGPVFASVMTGATLGMAGVQSSLIASQQFIPALATGGMASGLTQINEKGGEIVSLPDGSQVIPNDISQQIAGSSGGGNSTTIQVSFAGANFGQSNPEQIAEIVSRKLARRMKGVA